MSPALQRNPMKNLLARSAAVALVAGSLTTIATVESATPASAACAPSAASTAHSSATGTKARASKPTVIQSGKHRFRAVIVITATSGKGSATATRTVCPDGSSGAAVRSAQSATAKGVFTATVGKTGSSRKAAIASAKKAASSAKHRLASKAKKRGKAAAKKAALSGAVAKVHDDLYLSHIAYVNINTAGLTFTAHPTSTSVLERITSAPNGDLVVTVNVPSSGPGTSFSYPVLTRAKAWPSAFIIGGGTMFFTSGTLKPGDSTTMAAGQFSGMAGDTGGVTWGYQVANQGSASSPKYVRTSQPENLPAPTAARYVALVPQDGPATRFTVTFSGLRAGTTYPTSPSNIVPLTGGTPVELG